MSTPLYGGAITALLPFGLLDASLARPVPDSQEVWVDESHGVVIDLLECVSGKDPLAEHVAEVQRLGGGELQVNSQKTIQVDEPLVELAVYTLFPNDGQIHLPAAIGLLRLSPPASVDVLVTLTGVYENPEVELTKIMKSFTVKDKSLFV